MSILVIGFIINSLVSKKIENKISEILLKSESNFYTLYDESSNFSLIKNSLVLNNDSLLPKQAAIESLIKNESKKQALETLTLTAFKIKGIGLFNNKISIRIL